MANLGNWKTITDEDLLHPTASQDTCPIGAQNTKFSRFDNIPAMRLVYFSVYRVIPHQCQPDKQYFNIVLTDVSWEIIAEDLYFPNLKRKYANIK